MEVTKKFRIKPTKDQCETIDRTLNTLRGIYNLYIEKVEQTYELFDTFLSAYDFNYMLNHDWKPLYPWVHDVSSQARTDCILTVEKAYKQFFKHKAHKPQFKSKRRNPVHSFFFIRYGIRQVSQNSIWISILYQVKICNPDYFNPNDEITSGRIVKSSDVKYYMILHIKCKNPKVLKDEPRNNPIGVDMGIKTYATISDGITHVKVSNPNKRESVKRIESKIKSLQRVISRKVEINKQKGGTATIYHSHNIDKLYQRINKLRQRLNNIRTDFINKLVYMLVARTKPEYICIEDLNIHGLLHKSYHKLADYIAKCKWYYFSTHLAFKCKQFDVELRIANKLFASSKTCSECGHKKDKLKLTERTYVCKHCGLEIDRDINAAINLLKTTDYTLAN